MKKQKVFIFRIDLIMKLIMLLAGTSVSSMTVHKSLHTLYRRLHEGEHGPLEEEYAACLDEHQYPLFRHAMVQPICRNMLYGLTGVMDAFTFEMSDESGGESITDFLKESTGPVCTAFNTALLECMYLITPQLNDLLQCLHPAIVPSTFTAADLRTTMDEMNDAFCSVRESGRLCGEHLGYKLTSNSGTSIVSLLSTALNSLEECDTSLGCCGYNMKTLADRLGTFNLEGVLDETLIAALGFVQSSTCTENTGCTDPVDKPSWPETVDYVDALARSSSSGISTGPALVDYLPKAPQQIHLALTGSPSDSINVMWATAVRTEAAVRYGTDMNNLDMEKLATDIRHYIDVIKNVTVPQTYHYSVNLQNLLGNTTYHYAIRSEDQTSSTFTFTTASSDSTVGFTAAIFGDMGLYESETTLATLKDVEDQVDFYWQVGDIAYADNYLIHNLLSFGYEKVWNRFMNAIEPFAGHKPFMVVPGNHETECHSLVCLNNPELITKLGNFSAYNNRFTMPSADSKGVKNMWYSFNYGPVHFITISAETDYPEAPNDTYVGKPLKSFGNQHKWLIADLEGALQHRKEQPFIVVSGHRPMYSSTSQENGKSTGQASKLQEWLEPILTRYTVDLYISGHMHSYERMAPIAKNVAQDIDDTSMIYDPNHPIYIVHGAGGNEESYMGESGPDTSLSPNWFIKGVYNELGVGLLHVYNTTVMKWEYVGATSGIVLDSVVVDTSNRPYPVYVPTTVPTPAPAPTPSSADTAGVSRVMFLITFTLLQLIA